jgi:hypothetical protein
MSVDRVLARELEDVACAQAEELAGAVAGFAAALAWPENATAAARCAVSEPGSCSSTSPGKKSWRRTKNRRQRKDERLATEARGLVTEACSLANEARTLATEEKSMANEGRIACFRRNSAGK